MTISKTAVRTSHTGDAATVAFPFPYRVISDGDVSVYLKASGGTDVLQTLTTDYTISNTGTEAGVTVTMLTAPPTASILTIIYDIAITQSLDYEASDPFPAESHEQGLDRLTLILQQHDEVLGRTARTPASAGASPELSTPSRLIGTDATGQFVEYPIAPVFSAGDVVFYASVTALLASTESSRGTGAIWEAGGFRYIEVASGGDIATAGGVELDVLPATDGSTSLIQWGASATGTAATNAAAILAALQYGGKIVADVAGVITTNAVAATLTRDTRLEIVPACTIKGASGVSTSVLDFSGAFDIAICGGGTIDTSATTYTVGTSSGSAVNLDVSLARASVSDIHFFCASAYQSSNGDSGIQGTAAVVSVFNCRFSGHPDVGVYQAGTANEDANGVYDGPEGRGWNVIGCHFEYCQTAMATKRNAWGGSFTSNYVEWCNLGFLAVDADSGGVTLMSGKGWNITSNNFHKIKDRPIDVRYIGPFNINGNTIIDFGYTDDGVTSQAGYGIWLQGAQGVSGGGNVIAFREWTTTTDHAALRISELVFDSDGVNVTYEPTDLDLSVTVLDVYYALQFGSGLTTTRGFVGLTVNAGVSSIVTGTIPTDLNLRAINGDDVLLYQNGSVRFRVKNGQINMPALPTSAAGLASGDLWNNSGVVTVV